MNLNKRQNDYIKILKRTFNIHDAHGDIQPYDPMPYQVEFHTHSINCLGKHAAPDRITKKCRGTGATCVVCMDLIVSALIFENTSFPVSSITEKTGSVVIRWLQFLCDNANVELGRTKKISSRIVFNDPNTEIFRVPGNNPSIYRSFRTPVVTFDEYAHCENQEELWSAGRRCLSEAGQHNILSTPNTNTDQYWYVLQRAEEMEFKVFNWTLFPERYFNRTISLYELIDNEYLEAYEAREYNRMRELCVEAWEAGLWDCSPIDKELEGVPYHGKWDEDRGLIPIAPWLDIDNLEHDRIANVSSFMRENMGSIEEAGGTLIPERLIQEQATIPITYRDGFRIGNEEKQTDALATYVGGWDFGGLVHLAAFSLFKESQVDDKTFYHQVMVETFPLLDYEDQIATMHEICALFPGLYVIGVDITGGGLTFADIADRELDIYIKKLHMSTSAQVGRNLDKPVHSRLKKACATGIRVAFYDRSIYILNDPELKAEFLVPKEKDLETKGRKVKGLNIVNHADRFWASAYALYSAKSLNIQTPTMIGGIRRKGMPRKINPAEKGQKFLEQIGFPSPIVAKRSRHRIPKLKKKRRRKY
jgi:hypothetical protein